MDALEVLLKLRDEMTSPAQKAAMALKSVNAQIKEIEKATKASEAAQVKAWKKYNADVEKATKAAMKAKREMAANAKEASGFGAAMEALGPYAQAAAVGLTAVGGAIVGGLAMSAKANEFRDDTIDALSLVLESSDEAEKTFEQIQKISKLSKFTQEEMSQKAFELLNVGVSKDQLEPTLKALSDVAQVGPKGAAEKVQAVIERSVATGKFQINPKQLVAAGVQSEKLYATIAKNMGVGNEQVKAMLKNGQISADVGIKALNETIEGKIGGIAAKQLMDFDTQFKNLKDNFITMFMGDASSKAMEGFKKGLAELFSFMDKDTAVGKVFHAAITQGMTKIWQLAQAALPYIKKGFLQIAIGVLQFYLFMKPTIQRITDLFASWKESGKLQIALDVLGGLVKMLGGYIWFVVNAWVGFFTIVTSIIDRVQFQFTALVEWIKSVFTGGADIASNFVQGFIDGIMGSIQRVKDAVGNIANAAKDGISNVLQIHSPSKVMQELGGYTAEGFQIGMQQADIPNTMAAMVNPSNASGGAGGGSGSTSNSVDVGGMAININGVKDAVQLQNILPGMLATAFEDIALQLGAAT